MGFRIDKGVFQFLDNGKYISRFKINEVDGRIVEVDPTTNDPVDTYLKSSEKAADSDKVDGYHANNSGGGIPVLNSNGYWNSPSWINVYAHGIYSSNTNGAHFYPNNQTYGSWRVDGTRNGWYGIHFGGSTGVALMMNESESGVHRQGSGWKYRHQGGKFYVHTGTNGGGSGYPVWHSGNDGSGSGLDADLLDGYHAINLGNRDFTKQGFYVDGDQNTYYPVVISGEGRYSFNRYSITRHYGSTAPWDPIGTGSHKGGLTFDFYWSGDTAWGGNDHTIRVHQFSEQYTTMVGGISLARTGGMVVWLRGGHAYYELHTDASQPGITVYLDGYVDGSGTRFDPTTNVDANKHTIWANYPVRSNNQLYHQNELVATQSWTDTNFLRTGEKAADADKLDGYDWMQSGKSVRANEFYADNWFRNYNSGEGMYNENTKLHWYSDSTTRWRIRSGHASQSQILFCTSDNVARGYIHATSSNEIGFLDEGGSWGIKHVNNNGTYFYTDNSVEEFKIGRDAVTGNYGTVQTSTTRGSWGGYSIAGRVVFMHDHSNGWGIYNDVNNEWMVYGALNAQVELKYNNATKIATNSGGVTVTGTCTATAFSGDGSALTNLPIPDQGTPFTDATRGTNTTLASMTFDGRSMIFTMANGTSFVIDGARPNG